MTVFLMLGWWYGQGWLWITTRVQRQLESIAETFSVKILIRTWFSPWKQIKSTGSMGNFLSAAVDNTISRLVGASVRTIMLITAGVLSLLTIVVGLSIIFVWPLLPLLVVLLPVISLAGVGV